MQPGTVTGGSITTVCRFIVRMQPFKPEFLLFATYKDEEKVMNRSTEKSYQSTGGTYYAAAPKDIQG